MSPDQHREPEKLVPNQSPSIGARISVAKKAALKLYVKKKNRERSAAEGVLQESVIIRDSLDDWFRKNWDDLPQEARDMLDEDLVANAGGEEADA